MTLKAPPLLVVAVQQLDMHAVTACVHSGLGAGERAMSRVICSAVETEAVRCGILSPHCNSVTTFNNGALLELVGDSLADFADIFPCVIVVRLGVNRRCSKGGLFVHGTLNFSGLGSILGVLGVWVSKHRIVS